MRRRTRLRQRHRARRAPAATAAPPAAGEYCAACGQETRVKLPTARVFLREATGRYVALDGRLWRTLAALLFRPGFLTREYLPGRRRRYIRPARLFLVLSLALFAAIRIFASAPVIVADKSSERGAAPGRRQGHRRGHIQGKLPNPRRSPS